MNYDCIFLDRDGTINPDETGYVKSLDDYSFYDFTILALKQIAKENNRFCIMTNQSGVSRGFIKEDDSTLFFFTVWYLKNLKIKFFFFSTKL